MSTPHSNRAAPNQDVDPNLAAYRPVSGAAVLGLSLGIFSPVAVIHPILWTVPAVGVAVCIYALRVIAASDGAMTGRRVALIGLSLSLFFLFYAPAKSWSNRLWLRREAQTFAHEWFELLRSGQPEKAYQFTAKPAHRQPFDAELWPYYRRVPEEADKLRKFVDEPLVRALLALRNEAKVRYWDTEDYVNYDGGEQVIQTYAITYKDDGRPVTFIARLVLDRNAHVTPGAGRWQVLNYEESVRPKRPPTGS